MRILITGAAGYIGSLLTERLQTDPMFSHVVATDQNVPPELSTWSVDKVTFEQGKLEDDVFIARLERFLPLDAVIHAAFEMRAGYGQRGPVVAAINLKACHNVFQYCFDHQVGRLLYTSSAAAYGAIAGNRISHFIREDEPLGEEAYPYGIQKRRVEEMLRAMYAERKPVTSVSVVRPCSVTGPRGQRSPRKTISLITFLKRLLPVIPQLSPEWARQFLHEEDMVQIVRTLLRTASSGYEIFNLAPPDYLSASGMAEVLGKRVVNVPAWLVNAAFFVMWHGTSGRIPTAPGAINSFRYPINMDGSRILRTGFKYRYGSREALLARSDV
jgi:UDP-glucose 4-epimerase